MKTKLEMAHEWYMMQTRRNGCALVADAWKYADAMQAAADERKPKEPRETHKNLAEFSIYPEYDASINYPPDAWVMYKGEKRLAVSIDIKKEWQPDWSQAPDNALTWAINSDGYASWALYKDGHYFSTVQAPSFGYTGDWRNSLRKRPK